MAYQQPPGQFYPLRPLAPARTAAAAATVWAPAAAALATSRLPPADVTATGPATAAASRTPAEAAPAAPPATSPAASPRLPPQQQQQQQQLQHPPQQAAVSPTDNGAFPGGTYSISHRDTNAVLALTLQQGASVKSKSGAMIHMSSTIQLQGKIKFSMKKLITGSDLSESTYVGPGRVAVGPTLFGDIITLHVDGRTNWTIGKDSFLASTIEVKRETKAQGISKALFSGEDLFVYRLTGQGIIWLTSFGAVDRLDLQPGEQHIVDNGHLVAWSCQYAIERAGGGGGSALNSLKSGEGLVCRFTGPGSIYIQTRNRSEFESFIKGFAGGGGGGGILGAL
uniref:Altered inheritance of mitochondria protein 24, mitochondrial n=1 Tax=Bionectria ochroleuca TaxID=29856 RepID=A0A8H7NIP0_BIOOC